MFNDHTYTNHTQIQCFNILFILKEGRDVISYVHTAHPYLSNVYVSPGTVESTRHAVSQIINCSTICGFKSTFILNHYRSFEYYIGDEDLKTSVYQPHRTRFTTIRELLYHNSSSASVLSKLLRTSHTRLSAQNRTIEHRSINHTMHQRNDVILFTY